MGLTADFVSNASSQLNAVAQQGFNSIAGGINGVAAAAATLALVVVGLNIVLQYRPMPLGGILWTMVKLVLIVAVGLRWSEFSKITNMVKAGMDAIASGLLGRFGGSATSGTSTTSLAQAIDTFIVDFATKANHAMEPMSWYAGAMMSTLITFLMAIVAAACALIIVFSQVIIAVYLAVAPIFIACWIFEATKDYFTRWVQATVSYMLYPVIVAAVLGGMIRIITAFVDTLNTDATQTISDFIPFIACMIIMVISVVFIPTIVNSLSGMIQSASPFAAAVAGAAMGAATMAGGKWASGRATAAAPLIAAGARQQVQNVAGAMTRAENLAGKAWSRSRKY